MKSAAIINNATNVTKFKTNHNAGANILNLLPLPMNSHTSPEYPPYPME